MLLSSSDRRFDSPNRLLLLFQYHRSLILFSPVLGEGVVSFYNDFLESLQEFLDGNASITAIGQISHTSKDWESGRLFSLQEQIDHKIHFIKQELESVKVPIILEVLGEVLVGSVPKGTQFDARQFDQKLNEVLEGQDEFFTSYNDVHESFDAMGLQENLLRGIYAYGLDVIQQAQSVYREDRNFLLWRLAAARLAHRQNERP
ncbi:unnamed protein product, partial [Thlaspi arvense]